MLNYVRFSYHNSDSLVIDIGVDNGERYEIGYMHDFVGIGLTTDYPYKLYNFNLLSLGKKMTRFVKSDPRNSADFFTRLIKTQVSPDDTFYPNVGTEFSVANSACLDPLYVAPFDWDL